MIEWHTSGESADQWIPTWNGKWLHSQRNPVREAQLWVEQHTPRLEGIRTVFVLGLAGGFHVHALSEKFPNLRIVVIEAHEAFMTLASPFVQKLLPKIELLIHIDPYVLIRNKKIEPHLKETYCILEYKHATLLSGEYYSNVKSALLARDWKSFNVHIKLREQAWMNQFNFVEKENSLISVKHIANGIEPTGPITPEMMKWLCLRELVT